MNPLKLAGKWPQGLLLILPVILSLFAAPVARSEGSADLVSQLGDRPWLEVRDNAYIETFLRKTTIQVSVSPGEWINLGSSAMGIGSGNIIATPPNPFPNNKNTYNCKEDGLGTGLISNRTQESNGPGTGTNGSTGFSLTERYQPCVIRVGANQGGIWRIEFVPPQRPGTRPSEVLNPAGVLDWVQASTDFATAAWDVTVRTDTNNTVTQDGRVFTTLLALNMLAQGRALNSDVFVLTTDGFIYKTDMNQMDPFGFVFLANNKGILDNGNPTYRSSPGITNDGGTAQQTSAALNTGLTIQPPVHRIFFNEPATDLETRSTPILRTPTRPIVSDLAFIGQIENTSLQGVGGSFRFNSTINGSYQIVIRDSNNNIVRILQNAVSSGTNNIPWNGRDNNNVALPPGEYEFEITVRAGEYHFPLLDVENNTGLTFTLLNPPQPLPSEGPGTPVFRAGTDANTAFYDNRSFTRASGAVVTMPTSGNPGATDPVFGTGTGSSNYHGFGTIGAGDGFGDKKAIDTWIYFSSQPKFNTLVIIDPNVNLTSTKSVALLTDVNNNGQVDPGDTLRYTIALTNTGSSTATGVQLTDTPDANTTLVVGSVTPSQGSVTLGNTAGNTTVDVALGSISGNGGTATVTFNVTVNRPLPNTVTQILNQGRVRGSNFSPILTDDPTTQNIPNDPTSISLNNPILGVTKQLTGTPVNNGDGTYTLSYTIRAYNLGNVPLNNVQITEDLFGNQNSTFAQAAAPPAIISIQLVPGPNNEPNPLTATNPNFNGNTDKNLLAGTEVLPAGATAAIAFTVRVTPGSNLGEYENNATASATGPGGTPVTDVSTDGTNPDPDGDGDPTNNTNPTAVSFSEMPLIGVAKAAGTPTDNGDRTFTIPYTLIVRNYGDVPLTTLQVIENLNETFANIPYTLEPNSVTSPTLTVNPNFNGNTDTNLLGTGNTLAVDTQATINFAVRVTPGNNLGPFNNQVAASGTGPGGTSVSDLSTNGANPDGNNTGDPTDSNEITSVTLRGNPNLELEKRITRVNGAVVGQGENLPDWPTNFVRGLTASNTIQPGDEVEYTIYFLSAGSGPLENATVCDPLQDFQTFRTDTFNGQTPTEGEFGAEVGIALALNPPNPDLPTAYLRSANSTSNRGRFYPSGTATPLICEQNVRGAVVVDIGNLGVGDYGFIRFRVTID